MREQTVYGKIINIPQKEINGILFKPISQLLMFLNENGIVLINTEGVGSSFQPDSDYILDYDGEPRIWVEMKPSLNNGSRGVVTHQVNVPLSVINGKSPKKIS